MINRHFPGFSKAIFIIACIASSVQGLKAQHHFGSRNDEFDPSIFNSGDFVVAYPEYIVEKVEAEIVIYLSNPDHPKFLSEGFEHVFYINNQEHPLQFEEGKAVLLHTFSGKSNLTISIDNFLQTDKIEPIPLWLSIIPPLIAILLALLIKEVITSLFIGILSGTLLLSWFSKGASGIWGAPLKVIDTYIANAITDWGHVAVILFSLIIGGMVMIISKNGGMMGIVNKVSGLAKSARSAQLVTWLLGIGIFFDDYANTLIVGNTMRSITDKMRISREKLSYIVDSTAAPVAAIALVTTWIGAELGYIQEGIKGLEISESPYSIFLNSLPYSFYPIFTLCFMFLLIWKKRDFGPMLKAETRARKEGKVSGYIEIDGDKATGLDKLSVKEGVTPRVLNALIPIIVVIAGTIWGLIYTGSEANPGIWQETSVSFSRKLSMVIGASDSYLALLWSSLSALIIAIILSVGQRIMSLSYAMETTINGFRTMLPAIMILVLAWALAGITEDMHTADFMTNLLKTAGVSGFLLPSLTFLLSALIAFSTGSSWSTMAILYPIMIPSVWVICTDNVMGEEISYAILYNTVSCILAGSVMGDHCSPISDTTILSSLASSCNHIDHVKTQLPYALTAGGVAVFLGTFPASLGVPVWLTFPIGIIALYLIIRFVGKRVEA